MTNTEIIVNLATIIANQRLEISELKTEVEHLHHELLAMRVEADTPQTEETCERCVYVRGSQWCQGCNGTPKRWDGEKIVDTPQTDCEIAKAIVHKAIDNTAIAEDAYPDLRQRLHDAVENTPQTDCSTCKWGEWYRNGRDITNMDDECGGCCSWNNKWQPKEPQTDCPWK